MQVLNKTKDVYFSWLSSDLKIYLLNYIKSVLTDDILKLVKWNNFVHRWYLYKNPQYDDSCTKIQGIANIYGKNLVVDILFDYMLDQEEKSTQKYYKDKYKSYHEKYINSV